MNLQSTNEVSDTLLITVEEYNTLVQAANSILEERNTFKSEKAKLLEDYNSLHKEYSALCDMDNYQTILSLNKQLSELTEYSSRLRDHLVYLEKEARRLYMSFPSDI